MTSREAFEKWWGNTGDEDDRYMDLVFDAWQAAQEEAYENAARICENLRVTYGDGYPDGLDCATAIRAAAPKLGDM